MSYLLRLKDFSVFLIKTVLCNIVIICVISSSCQTNKLLLESNTPNGSQIPSDTLISISKSETLDQWFTLDISADGKTTYTPTKYNGYNRTNLPPQGVPIKGQISLEQLEEIIREFENQKFFSLRDSYNQGEGDCKSRVLDAGVRTISIKIKGQRKSVEWRACRKDGKDLPSEFFVVYEKINAIRSKN